MNQSYFKEREGKQNRKEKGNRGVEASQIFKAFLLLRHYYWRALTRAFPPPR